MTQPPEIKPLPSQAMPIHVVSLARSPERRARSSARLGALGLSFTFFDAVDGRALSEAELGALELEARAAFFSHPLARGEIGCFLSHKRLFELGADDAAPMRLVLEDDADVDETLPALLAQIAALEKFDLIWLCGGPKAKRYAGERRLTDKFNLVRPYESKSTTQGYVVSRAGAAKLARHCARLIDPIDIAIKRYWEYGGDVFNVMPSACWNFADLEEASTIDGRTNTKKGLTMRGSVRHNLDEVRKTASFASRLVAGGTRVRGAAA